MRMKAKTSPTGYLATLAVGQDLIEFPVAKFDDEGWALILDLDGRLVRAADKPEFVAAGPMLQVNR